MSKIRERVMVKLTEAFKPKTRVEIDKKEFDDLAAKHRSAPRNGKYSDAIHVYKRHKETHVPHQNGDPHDPDKHYVVRQTYSHEDHKLPTIEKDANGKHWKYK